MYWRERYNQAVIVNLGTRQKTQVPWMNESHFHGGHE